MSHLDKIISVIRSCETYPQVCNAFDWGLKIARKQIDLIHWETVIYNEFSSWVERKAESARFRNKIMEGVRR